MTLPFCLLAPSPSSTLLSVSASIDEGLILTFSHHFPLVLLLIFTDLYFIFHNNSLSPCCLFHLSFFLFVTQESLFFLVISSRSNCNKCVRTNLLLMSKEYSQLRLGDGDQNMGSVIGGLYLFSCKYLYLFQN